MTDYDHAEALLSLREAHDDEPVPRDELDADAQILDDLARRGEIVETDDGLVPTEAYESTEEIPLPDGGKNTIGIRGVYECACGRRLRENRDDFILRNDASEDGLTAFCDSCASDAVDGLGRRVEA